MTESWNRTAPRRGTTASGFARLVSLMVAALLVLAINSPLASADSPSSGDSRLLAPIADVLSASSWLWATGQDPRSSPVMAGSALWQANGPPAATPLANPGDTIVTRVVGQFPVSSEPSLAIDPRDPDHLVLAVIALDLPSVATYVSENGGRTWDGPHQAPYFAGDNASLGAPIVAFDGQGIAYLAARSVAIEPVPVGLQRLPVERVRITLSRSDDGGRQWGSAVSAVTTGIATSLVPDASGLMSGSMTTAFLDSPSLTIGADPRRPGREIITIAYAELRTSFILLEAPERVRLTPTAIESSIQVIRSDDGGQSWTQPIAVSPVVARGVERPPVADAAPGDAIAGEAAPVAPAASSSVAADGDQVVQGPRAVALDDGAIAVAYFDTTRDGPHRGLARVMIALSDDGGRTYSEPRQAGVYREIADRPATAFFRWWDGAFPHLTPGPDGALYVAVAARVDGQGASSASVLLFRSLDRGEQWESLPLGLADTSGAPFFPAIVAPGGVLYAIWGQLGAEPAGAGYVIRAAASEDGGDTWHPLAGQGSGDEAEPVLDAVSNALVGFPGGQYLGSGLAIAAAEESVDVAWPDTRSPAPAGPGQQIAFARIPASQQD